MSFAGRRLIEDDGRELSIGSPERDFDGPIAEPHGHTGDQGDDDEIEDDPFAKHDLDSRTS